MNGEEWEYLLSSVASNFLIIWYTYKWGRSSVSCKSWMFLKTHLLFRNCEVFYSTFCHPTLIFIPASLGSHSVSMSQVFWRITKDTTVITCGLMCMSLMTIAKSTKIFVCSDMVILYLSIAPWFLLFSLLLLQYCYSPFSIQNETQI